jgi:hypothetical protein
MNKRIFLLLFLGSFVINAQHAVNNYKYVIVSKRFDFQRTENQYQLNDLAEFLFEKYNFNPVFEDDYPEDLYRNKCLGLKSTIVDESSMFVTKLKVELRNCKDSLIYTSKIGKSKRKEYQATYQEAMRRAFESLKTLNYKYIPSDKDKKPVVPKVPSVPIIKAPVSVPNEEAILTDSQINEESIEKEVLATNYPILYAQARDFGFQLVDTNPEIVYQIYSTGKKNVFIIKGRNGIFYKQDSYWVAEFYNEEKPMKEFYRVKF